MSHRSIPRYRALAASAPCVVALALALALPAAPADAAPSPEGFLYGKVKTRGGTTYQGRLRWGKEEAFWGDFFNSSKEDRAADRMSRQERRQHREPIEIFGVEVGVRWSDGDGGRQFISRFGDIQSLELRRSERVTARMKDGTSYDLDGGSNDLGAQIKVWDPSLGTIALDWDEIDQIEFLPTPRDLSVDVFRLYGTVETDAGQFRGWIQWDQEECLSTDQLDGETRDGDLSIDMGHIQSIERRSHIGSRVKLKEGRELELEGTNDVNDENRGIFVEDPRFGRVEVSWDAFEKVVFEEPPGSGPAYGDFTGKPIHGTVTTADGDKHTGNLAYDLDEERSWEMLDGTYRDVEYHIPFALIAAVVPDGRRSTKVTLRGGEELRLEEQTDVDDSNAGIEISSGGSGPAVEKEPGTRGGRVYVDWEDVRRIDFD